VFSIQIIDKIYLSHAAQHQKLRKKKRESNLDDQDSSELRQSPSTQELRKAKLVKSQKKK
jgi:hypothetical protein